MHTDNARGAFLMLAGMAAFTLSDTIMKLLGAHLPLFQTLLWRGLAVSAVLAAVAWRMGAFRVAVSSADRRLIVMRALADTGSTWFFLQALYHMPIANLTAIMQALPLTVTLGAALFMGETVGWRRLLAIMVGFAGVLLIVRPDTDGFDLHAGYALLCVGFVTLRDLLTRRMARSVPTFLIALTNAGFVTVFGLIGTTTETLVLPDARSMALLAGTAGFIVFGYVLTVMAVRTGELGFVTPFRYTGLVWALIVGLLVFGEWPDPVTLAGAGLIVATGLFTLYRERLVTGARSRGPGRN
jgi:drug/metabolite transporter (DMT)-like permease